jgi:hypothetical protein
MRAIHIGLAFLCCLNACSQGEGNLFRSSNQQRTIGDALSVTVTNVVNEAEAQPFAEQYCKARGKRARFNHMVQLSYRHVASNSASFDCVIPAN